MFHRCKDVLNLVGIGHLHFDHADRVADQQECLRILHRHDDEGPVIVIDADFEDRRDLVADLARDGPERRGAALRVDDGDRVAHARTDVLCKANTDCDLARPRLQRIDIAGDHLLAQFVDVGRRVAAHQDRLDPTVEGRQQRLFDQRRGFGDAGCVLHFLKNIFPVVEPSAIGLHDRVAIQAHDFVQQFGPKTVHHAHHDHQHGDREHDDGNRYTGDERNESLAPARKQIAFGNGPFER